MQQNEFEIGRKQDDLQRKQLASEAQKNELSEILERKNREVERLQGRYVNKKKYHLKVYRN